MYRRTKEFHGRVRESGQPYDRVMPLITGEVNPEGIKLEYQGLPGGIPGLFYDQLKFQRFDVSEMSFSSFLVERAKGYPYRLLPVSDQSDPEPCSSSSEPV